MKKLISYNNFFLKAALLLFPLIPYNIIVPEVTNPLIFLTLSMLLVFNIKGHKNKKDIYWIILFLISFISVFIAKDKVIVFMDSFSTLIIIPAYFIGKSLKKEDLADTFSFIFYGGILNALLSIFRYLGNRDIRLDGVLNYANSSAIYFGLCIIIYLYTSKGKKSSCISDSKLCFVKKRAEELGAIIIGSSLFLTQSRAAIVIYILISLYVLIVLSPKNKTLVKNKTLIIDVIFLNIVALFLAYLLLKRNVIAFGIAAFIIILASCFKEKINPEHFKSKYRYIGYLTVALLFIFTIMIFFKRIINIGANSGELQERFVFYQDGINILTHNILGIGSGMLSSEQFKYQTALYDIKYIHNGPLQIGLDFGVIFLLLFMLLTGIKIFKGINKEKLAALYFVTMIMIILHSLIDFTMSFAYIDIIFGLSLSGLSTEDEDSNWVIKAFWSFFRAAVLAVSAIILLLLPGEIIYNMSYTNLMNNNPKAALKNLQLWDEFPFKSERYYNKKVLIYYLLYTKNQNHNKNYLLKSISNSNKAIKINQGYGVDYALLATEYSELGDYKKAAQSLEKQIGFKKFYIKNYDALMEAYHKLYYSYAITEKNYFNKIKQIESEIHKLKRALNPKAKYMKNQPDGKLNDYELIKIAEAYMIVNDTEGYFKYLNLAHKKSYEYKQFISK